MFIVDTNVVSEIMRPVSEPAVELWTAGCAASSLFLTAITEAELRLGLATMPPGRRRDGLSAGLERMLRTGFASRILPFDSDAARAYAEIVSTRRAARRAASQSDSQIVAIARSRGMAVATRNVRDFEGTGVAIVDPWAGA